MKLVCTILCGPDLSNLARAVASIVDHVDEILLVNTCDMPIVDRLGADSSCLDSRRISIHWWPWQGRFDAARNEALALATEAGASWAVTLDADEWYDGAEHLRSWCARAEAIDAPVEAIELPSGEGDTYYQPRVLRLPCQARWIGRTHEAIALKTKIVAQGKDVPTFRSDAKTPEQVCAKAERDVPLLLEEIAERPLEARWHHYLGNSYCCLGADLDGSDDVWTKAIDAYFAAANLSTWPEEKAIVLYLAARVMLYKRRDFRGVIDTCMHGLAAHAGIAELPWLAADAARLAGDYEQAVYLAALAEVHGERGLYGAVKTRMLHVSRDATRDGPAKVLAEVFRRTGALDLELAERAKIEGWLG